MKREIKFRAWSHRTNSFVKKEYMMFSHNDNGIISLERVSVDGDFEETDESVAFQQFTGLKDKNGKEIYEGDIIKGLQDKTGLGYLGNNRRMLPFKGVVICSGASFVVEIMDQKIINSFGGTKILYFSFRFDCLEIIGNIYENSELLNPQTPH